MFPLTNKEPYIKSSGERTTLGDMFAQAGGDISELEQEVDALKEALTDEIETRAALGAHNLLPYPYYDTTKTENDVTFTDMGDGTVKVYSTGASAQTTFLCVRRSQVVSEHLVALWKEAQYKVLGATSDIKMKLDWYDSSSTYIISSDYTKDGVITPAANAKYVNIFIVVPATGTADNVVVKPQIVLATDSDPTYQPYAMTNKELTDVKIDASQIAPIENGATASTSYAQGAYFIHNGKFCKAKTSISSGATFTKGTNYEETTVAAELIALA